jgi:cytochrome P450 family 142 subfamily A polypeptide 1
VADHPFHPDIQLLDGSFYANDVHTHLTWMRENAPVYRDPSSGVWGITLHEDIQKISRDWTLFSNAQGMRPDYPGVANMICMDDPAHKRRRNLVNRGFTKNRVEDHEPKVRQICRGLIDQAAKRGEFDFVRDVAAPLPMIMIGDMLGVLPEDRDTLLRWSDDLMAGLTGIQDLNESKVAAMTRANEEYAEYCLRVIDQRREHPGDDLMSILVHGEVEGERLDDEALIQESLLILIGGDETTRHVISGGMHQLLENPDARDALAADLSRIPRAVEEMLRWVTPILNMARTVTEPVELRGQRLAAGEKLILLYPSGNRDASVFDAPFRFDIDRHPNPHVAFGGNGAHFCLGASLARLELRVMFEEVLARAPDLERTTEGPPPLRPANFVSGIETLPVRAPNG